MPLGMFPGSTAVQKMRDPIDCDHVGQVHFLARSGRFDPRPCTVVRRTFPDDDRSHVSVAGRLTTSGGTDARSRDDVLAPQCVGKRPRIRRYYGVTVTGPPGRRDDDSAGGGADDGTARNDVPA